MLHRIAATIGIVAPACALGLCLAAGVLGWSVPAPRAHAHDAARLVIEAQDGTRLVTLDRADMAALPQTAFTTHTIWTEGPQRFDGVSLAALLAHYRIEAGRLDLVAVNDYTVTLPADGIGPVYPVIAHSRNGAPMSLRDKGPYWLVYNYDADPAFQRETIYLRSIWQLDRITVHPAPG
jgi:hypothetical protein